MKFIAKKHNGIVPIITLDIGFENIIFVGERNKNCIMIFKRRIRIAISEKKTKTTTK